MKTATDRKTTFDTAADLRLSWVACSLSVATAQLEGV